MVKTDRSIPQVPSGRRLLSIMAMIAVFAMVLVACAGDEPDDETAGSDANDRPTVEAAGSSDSDEESSDDEDTAANGEDTDEADESDGSVQTMEDSGNSGPSTRMRYHVYTMEDEQNGERISMVTYDEQPTEQMEALMQGELTRSGGCVGVSNPDSGEFVSVVWPEGYSFALEDGEVVLLDESESTVAQEGEIVSISGGNTPDPDDYITAAAPEDCKAESYWMSGDEVLLADSTTGEASGGDSDDVQTEEEAMKQDAQMYADEYGISLEEAERRMELQSLPGPLQEELTENEADRFGGLYIEHEPEFRVVVLMTDGDEETVRSYIDDPELDEIVEIEQVEYTYEELLTTQEEVMELLLDLDLQVSGGPNVKENRVEISAPDPDAVESALEDAGEELPDNVVIVGGEQPETLED